MTASKACIVGIPILIHLQRSVFFNCLVPEQRDADADTFAQKCF